MSSINAARFITHLRYFFARAKEGKQLDKHPASFVSSVRESFPQAFHTAQKIRALLELHLSQPLTDDEQVDLALHIERLASTA